MRAPCVEPDGLVTTRTVRALAALTALCWAPAAAAAAGPAPRPTLPPFDPSLHIYQETLDGGNITIVAHGQKSTFVAKIRSQLRTEEAAYARGDYPQPAPGAKLQAVTTLHDGSARMTIRYSDIQDGGTIVFKSRDASLVAALHDWFAATVKQERKEHPDGGPGLVP